LTLNVEKAAPRTKWIVLAAAGCADSISPLHSLTVRL